jgi:hypothetical protein
MWKYYLFYSKYLSPFPALISGLIRYKYLNGGIKWIFWFVVFGTVMQLLSRAMIPVLETNLPGMHIYVPVKFFLFSMAYRHFLDGFLNKKVIYGITLIVISYSIINSFFIQSIYQQFPNFVRALCIFILAVYAMLWFLKSLREMKITRLRAEPIVWINTGAVIYFSGSFFIFILSNLVLEHSLVVLKYSFRVSSFLMILFYILIALGFWKTKKA